MNYKAVYFPEQWSITNGGVPVCHFQGEHNNKEFAEFIADLLNAQQSEQADGVCPDCHEPLINGVCPALYALQA